MPLFNYAGLKSRIILEISLSLSFKHVIYLLLSLLDFTSYTCLESFHCLHIHCQYHGPCYHPHPSTLLARQLTSTLLPFNLFCTIQIIITPLFKILWLLIVLKKKKLMKIYKAFNALTRIHLFNLFNFPLLLLSHFGFLSSFRLTMVHLITGSLYFIHSLASI